MYIRYRLLHNIICASRAKKLKQFNHVLLYSCLVPYFVQGALGTFRCSRPQMLVSRLIFNGNTSVRMLHT
jgi:hypothetical protein